MEIDKLKERTSFILGDLNYPTPGKLCLIKFTDRYLNRSNRQFDTKYIAGELKIINKKPYVYFHTIQNEYSYRAKEITCAWTNNIVENWYYMDAIEQLLNKNIAPN
jgi:hypothetical protein